MEAFKSYFTEKLKKELPGKAAHIEAAPFRRIDFSAEELMQARSSAVLILFYKKNNEMHIVLIQRPTYDGAHSGQIALPGGKVEKTDKDINYTALREAFEEVGVAIEDVEVITQLTDVYIPVSRFNVTPVVGLINYLPNFKIDNHEVEELIELKLSELVRIDKLEISKIKMTRGGWLETPCFNFNGKIVWGATALILNELRWVLRNDS
ncbi:MAG: NUDIX hydrolase [Vicingaceae bacterium]